MGVRFLGSASRHSLLLSLSLLLLLSYSVEGSSRLLVGTSQAAKEEGDKAMMEGAMIGSRPPSCEGRCSTCGHCEAVQVPLAPSEKQGRDVKGSSSVVATVDSGGDEYSSNYKPMNWKCKCGGMILNP